MTQNPSKDINKTIYVQKDMSQQNYLSLYEDDTIDLFDLFLTIWNWKWLIILIFILGTFGSYGVTSILPKTYEASVLFLIEDENALKRVVSNPKLIYKIVKNEIGFKVWSSSHERQLSGSWLPGATCDLNPVFPGATWEGGGSAHIAQNHQINIPHRVAHSLSPYCSENPPLSALNPPASRRHMSDIVFEMSPFRSRLPDLNPGKMVSRA